MAAPARRKAPRGAFITFEGVDGCGKTTQAELLTERLRAAGRTVVLTREPGGTPVGQGLRDVLLNPAHRAMTPTCELLLFLADRVQHLAEVIVPALQRGEVVVCDRYHDSTVAYQQYGRKLDFSAVEGVIATHIAVTPPALTLWLDVELETAQGRINKRQFGRLREVGEALAQGRSPEPVSDTRLEDEALNFHLRVQAGYAALLRENPRRMVRLDGALPPDALGEAVWGIVQERLDVL